MVRIKSPMQIRQSFTRMLSLLKSLCTKPAEWRCARADAGHMVLLIIQLPPQNLPGKGDVVELRISLKLDSQNGPKMRKVDPEWL
jgi:hypothetical protein